MSKNVYSAINQVMQQVGYVEKKGAMSGYGDKYSYAKESDFIAAIRPAMVEVGLVMYPVGVEDLQVTTYQTAKGTTMNHIVGLFSFAIAHAESGEMITVKALGDGTDTGDKASYKAMTGAMKYAMRQAFVIETGDDPDDSPSSEQERQPEKKGPMNSSAALAAVKGQLSKHMNSTAGKPDAGEEMDPTARQTLAIKMGEVFANDDERHAFMEKVTGKDSITKLTKAEGWALYSWASNPKARAQVDDILAG